MKTLNSLAILIFPIVAMGQIIKKNVEEIKVVPPVFAGTKVTPDVADLPTSIIGNYLYQNFEYPEIALNCQEEGTGVVRFVVTPNGKLTDFQVINSVCPVIDEEFIRVLKSTEGMWSPGANNGIPVKMEKEVSMMFVTNPAIRKAPKEYFLKQAKSYWIKATELFLEKNNAKKALRNYNHIIKYMPYDASALMVRGLCKYELGDRKGARNDWDRLNKIGNFNADWNIEYIAHLAGYKEMMLVINK